MIYKNSGLLPVLLTENEKKTVFLTYIGLTSVALVNSMMSYQ